MRNLKGLDRETREMIVETFRGFAERRLSLGKKLEMDMTQEFPEDLIRELLGEELGLQLVFLPEEFGGMGGGAKDIAILSEEMAKADLGVATAFLAISLGTDPIIVGCTPVQKEKWLRQIAAGRIVAYAVTEPEAGSNLQSIKTTATPVVEGGRTVAYRINGAKQFISNGGYAEIYTVLANAPGGPTFFVVEKGAPGLKPGKHEDKHGIRCSNTSALSFEDVLVPVENLIGGVEGQGLRQANEVFGYTRLMVAAFGLGGGAAAMEKTLAYARERKQFGQPLMAFQGYTHKLVVPHMVRLEAARAYIEEVAARLDSGKETDLQVEGSIAKLFATEAGNAAAEAAIQAHGGYGYIREYEVEKIKRDVKITCIYEGTSEIQQNIIGLFRFRTGVRSKGKYYGDMARELEAMPPETGGPRLSGACSLFNDVLSLIHEKKLTRQQHAMFCAADMAVAVEVGTALCRKAARGEGGRLAPDLEKPAARLFAAEAAETVLHAAARVAVGTGADPDGAVASRIRAFDAASLHRGAVADLDGIAAELAK